MKQKLIAAIFIIILSAIAANSAAAQERSGVTVTIRVRQADGSPLVGEKVMLVRPPEDEPVPPICATDSNGECAWFVGRGLYTLHFETVKIDPISILGPAEAGLTGLSITVGDEDITYSFAVANENHVYFDQAPDAPIPEPFIPTLEDVRHDHYRPTPGQTPQAVTLESSLTAAAPAGEDGDAPPGSSDQSSQAAEQFSQQWLWSRLRFLLIVIAGCLIGFALFIWQQRRQSKGKQAALTKANAAVDESSSPIIHPPPAGDEFFN